MLLAIGITRTLRRKTTDISTFRQFFCINRECHHTHLTVLHRHLLCKREQLLLSLRIKNSHHYLHILHLVRLVCHCCSHRCLVPITQEPRHIRLHHERFLRHGIRHKRSITHSFVMCQSHETPCSDTFGQCKHDGSTAFRVRHNGRHKERRLREVTAKWY